MENKIHNTKKINNLKGIYSDINGRITKRFGTLRSDAYDSPVNNYKLLDFMFKDDESADTIF